MGDLDRIKSLSGQQQVAGSCGSGFGTSFSTTSGKLLD